METLNNRRSEAKEKISELKDMLCKHAQTVRNEEEELNKS